MRFSASIPLYIAAFGTLWLGCLSCANPLPLPGGTPPRRVVDIPGIEIEKAHPAGKGKTYTALVRYYDKPGFLKCTKRVSAFKRERTTLRAIHTGNWGIDRVSSKAKKLFVDLLEEFPPSNNYYCLLLERLSWPRLSDYASGLSPEKKDQLLPDIFVQIITAYHRHDILALKYLHRLNRVHGDIKPQNIIIDDTLSDAPRAILIDFDGAQLVDEDLKYPVSGTNGYRPPEDYYSRPVNLYKRDSWMLGATLYSALTGRPPYKHISVLPLPNKELDYAIMGARMRNIARSGTNTFAQVKNSHNTNLLALMDKLLTVKVKNRPAVSELDASMMYNLARNDRIRAYLSQLWSKVTALVP
ncbi:kinase-like domain-containing protein [Thamnocephalis sphaerospora]|uniref:Kinase-like domain-containing protein n=1 Tax=Thamnocephalis sphaerospora TaxID=78915 RepID=A0A4P9XHV1_9FUNG|nr:kinase-like domain-containing protein [Thamnocephalis sphaerospora]|eukprot:RKP05272.1 kinase-like domain-containing protein [Thamnocephalis sphaerospora]